MSKEITSDQKDWLLELNNQILRPSSKLEDHISLLEEIKFHELLDYSDSQIDPPLITAVMMGRKDWVLALLRMGAKIDVKNNQSQSLFDVLNKHNDPILKKEMINFLKTEQMTAFNMAQHLKLGAESPAHQLPRDIFPVIAEYLKKDGRENDGR